MNAQILNQILTAGIKGGASDIHLKVGKPPTYRIAGSLREVKAPKLKPADTRALVELILANDQEKPELNRLQEYDTSYSVPDVGRFRVNIYRQRGTLAAVLRIIPFTVPDFQKLGLPESLAEISLTERGLVIVTGVTGSGKTSTLAAMVNYINTQRTKHIITIEDPIEFIHPDQKCSVSQREIGRDTSGFAPALRAALREDPDVIMVGEMRDLETTDIGIKAAETGHLVLSTVHTTDASKTLNRLIGIFPAEEQTAVRLRLADALVATISQRLLPRKEGKGRVLAVEVMRNTTSIRECIREPNKLTEIKGFIEKGRETYGMQSFDQHLSELYKAGMIDLGVAKAAATNPSDFERALHFE